MSERPVVWFSCGGASAVAAKLAIAKYGDECRVVYCDTMQSEHPDNRRFMADVEAWIGRPITVIRSEKYASVDEVFDRTRYMAGLAGARCTVELKRLPREEFQESSDVHIFGYTAEETRRAESFDRNNPGLCTDWVLIEAGVTKEDCYRYLIEAGIRLPAMYDLGFDHNNCIGCVKASSPGYWARTRRAFPEVFARRAKQCRDIGARLAIIRGERVFIDEVPEDAEGPDGDISCGPVCHAPRPVQLGLFGISSVTALPSEDHR